MKAKTKTWLELACNDLAFAKEILANKKRPYYVAHFCHQAIEKLLKAIVQETTDDIPLRTHNLKALCQQAGIDLPLERLQWIVDITPHYLGTKYPEDISVLYRHYTLAFARKLYRETEEFFQWLQKTFQLA